MIHIKSPKHHRDTKTLALAPPRRVKRIRWRFSATADYPELDHGVGHVDYHLAKTARLPTEVETKFRGVHVLSNAEVVHGKTRSLVPQCNGLGCEFCILEVPTREEALEWAARFATACWCAQEVLEIMDDPEV